MSQLFSLDAQKCGAERHTFAEAAGLGITVYTDGVPHRASSINDAIHTARDYIGEFLQPAQRGGVPWGLRVTVSGGVAVYGEWPLVSSGGGSPSFENSPLVKIRNLWHDSGPISALENAVQIIRAYGPTSAQRAA
jgi:hypothetical protein